MSPSKRSELAALLRRLADYVDRRRDDEELSEIFLAASELLKGASRKGSLKKAKPAVISADDCRDIAKILGELQTRESGITLLKERISNREGLERLARHLELPVQRDDSGDRLRDKIVEAAIGARLRSQAIRGND